MHLPEVLQQRLDALLAASPSNVLKQARETLTQTYQQGGGSLSVFKDPAQRLAYLATRMPATYAAVFKVLSQLTVPCSHFLDLGAGPGTASWAALECFPDLQKITCVERSSEAIELGKQLAQDVGVLSQIAWVRQSLTDPFAIPEADVAVLSYVLNELDDPAALVKRLWEGPIRCLVLIEPGTPKGFQTLRALRLQLLEQGAHIAAPCPHALACPMQGGDWCHFAARVERTRVHRLLKGGALGHEDEKFSYLAVCREPVAPFAGRVVRIPQKGSGHVRLKLCTAEGTLQEKIITRSDKEHYRAAKKTEWGDSWM